MRGAAGPPPPPLPPAAAEEASGGGVGGGGLPVLVGREECAYARCYCEENVFHLCRRLADALSPGRGGLHPSPLTDNDDGRAPLVAALFISNARKCVPIWGQRRGEGEDERVEDDGDEPVLWDYHVVCLLESPAAGAAWVYDLDTTLQPFPVPAATYIREAFRPQLPIRGDFRQRFRLVPFPLLQQRFASDRSHMRRADGGWNAPPPPWPLIRGPNAASSMTLPQFWDVAEEAEAEGALGSVLSLPALMRRLGMAAVVEEEEEDDEEEQDEGDESD